jgi:hypothetical protein
MMLNFKFTTLKYESNDARLEGLEVFTEARSLSEFYMYDSCLYHKYARPVWLCAVSYQLQFKNTDTSYIIIDCQVVVVTLFLLLLRLRLPLCLLLQLLRR